MLLIGQDVPDVLIPINVHKGGKGAPCVRRTLLGWSLNNHKALINLFHADLRAAIGEMWKVGASVLQADSRSGASLNDDCALYIWNESVSHHKGYYEIGIPFKQATIVR